MNDRHMGIPSHTIRAYGHARVFIMCACVAEVNRRAPVLGAREMSTTGARLRIATALTGAGAMDYGCVRRDRTRVEIARERDAHCANCGHTHTHTDRARLSVVCSLAYRVRVRIRVGAVD